MPIYHAAQVENFGNDVHENCDFYKALTGKNLYCYSAYGAEWSGIADSDLSTRLASLKLVCDADEIQAVALAWYPLRTANYYANTPANIQTDRTAMHNIGLGTYDSYITQQAQKCKAFGYPIYMRWGAEMNINQWDWGYSASDYVLAFQKIVTLFRNAGANNVKFIWNPNAGSEDGTNTMQSYYPGDSYIDWIGIDTYQWSDTQSNPAQQIDIVYNAYKSTGKPFSICEWGVNSYSWSHSLTPDATQADWMDKFFTAVEARPLIQMIAYFFVEWYQGGVATYHFQFGTANNPAPLTAAKYKARIANPLYIGSDINPVMGAKVIKAIFTQILNTPSTIIAGQGTVARSPDQPGGYVPGTEVIYTATPAAGWKFDNWEVDGTAATANPIKVTV